MTERARAAARYVLPVALVLFQLPGLVRDWPQIAGSASVSVEVLAQLLVVLAGAAVIAGGAAWLTLRRAAR